VFCQLEALRHCLPPNVRRILKGLPKTLDETYERALREINEANREHAYRLLQCLTVALRPLHVKELAEVLAIDFDAPAHGGIPELNPNWRWANQHQAVLSTCSSLITIVKNGNSRTVQFSHFSVREFLTSDRLARSSADVSRYHILLEPAHTILAQACLGVLLRLDNRVDERNVCYIPLVQYAARYWVDHAQFQNVASRIRHAMEYFFDADKPYWQVWSRVQQIDVLWEWFSPRKREEALPLYYASLAGFYDLAERLIGKHPEQINSRGGLLVSPLVAALHGKHFQVAELLHRNGADVDVRGKMKNTPLRISCRTGALDIVSWLLDHGADVNALGRQRYGPLHEAVDYGHLQAVQMLLEHNVDIHTRTKFGESPLHVAARAQNRRDQVDIMRILLNHGANPNARDDDNSTPLHYSSWFQKGAYDPIQGTVEGAHLLLEHGAFLDAKDSKGRTPLQLALEHGRHDIAKYLRDYGTTRCHGFSDRYIIT
jgi:ankyrin repeat protein